MAKNSLLILAFCAMMALPLAAQQPVTSPQNPTNPPATDIQQDNPAVEPMAQTPVFRINVVERTARAVDYRHNSESTNVDFQGTSIEPKVDGKATIKGHTGRLAIDAQLHHLEPARTFGPEYLTYVLWAITPEGRPVNLGEVVPNDDGNARLQLTTDLQAFGLILTAEPYFAVTRPSDMVVAQNVVRSTTKGPTTAIDAKFDALERGAYTINLHPAQLPATGADKHTPVDLLEARNAIAIAQAAGADQYAGDSLAKAKAYLNQAEDYFRRKAGNTAIGTQARAAVQTAEDARVLAIRQKQEERAAAERRAAEERAQAAKAQAEAEADQRRQAEEQAQREAEQRQQAESQAQAAQQQLNQQTEQARLQQQQAEQQAEQARQQAQQAEQERLRLQQQSELERQRLQQQAEQARQQAQQAEQARLQAEQQSQQMRQRLVTQLNQVLQTKDTARGVVASMPDVLFDFGKATLRAGARERLAKVAGIVLAYPDLKLEIDGHTDSIGSDQFNERLSEARANVVRDYLVRQGVPAGNIVARGFGKSEPIATNATPEGRQLNRRVELVMSGTAIGTNVAPGRLNGGASASTTGGVAGTSVSTTSTTTTEPANNTNSGTVAAPASPTTPTTTPATTPPAQATPVTPPPAQNIPPAQTTTPIPPR